MQKAIYHQTVNTNSSELSTYLYDYNTWEFNTLHFHKNIEILLVAKGRCVCTVGTEEYVLSEGDAIYIFPFRVHAFRLDAGAVLRCITFSELLILTFSRMFVGRTVENPVFRPSKETFDYVLRQLLLCFGRRYGHNRTVPSEKRIKVKGLLYLLGGELLSQLTLIPDNGNTAPAAEIVQYLSENFKKNISLHDIAEEMGYNYQYLSRTFNKVFGIKFKRLLNQYRLDNAYALLVDTDLPIAQVCFESGFQSLRSFHQICHEVFGKSPRAIRNG